MKGRYTIIVVFLYGFLFLPGIVMAEGNIDSLSVSDSVENERAVPLSPNVQKSDSTKVEEEKESEKAKEEVNEEIPLVFAQWWFWVGLILILLFIKYVVFKK